MKRSPDDGSETRASCNLISYRNAGCFKGRRAGEPARAVDDEDASASLKAFHMSL